MRSKLAVAVAVALSAMTLALLSPVRASAESYPEERARVERLHAALLESMRQGARHDFATRRKALAPVVLESFDFEFMAEKSAGRYWRELGPEDRKALVAAMSDLAISNYAARFHAFDGERFETLGAEAAPYETVLVQTEIRDTEGKATRLDYRMRRAGDQTRIVDVFLNGTVSELALRRAEYSSVIGREGFPALLSALRERVSALPVSARR